MICLVNQLIPCIHNSYTTLTRHSSCTYLLNVIILLIRKDNLPMMRFDRFTERAQEAAQRAAEIIQRYGHNQIDTEHILLALIEQPGGVIPQILEKLTVSAEALTERLDATLRASPKANIFRGGAGQIFNTPRVKR